MKSIFLLLVLTISISYGQTDEESIISLLERESSTWRSGDIEGHANC
ncbi:MAG: hypothetical protein V7687_11005 [Maribacter arcticus]